MLLLAHIRLELNMSLLLAHISFDPKSQMDYTSMLQCIKIKRSIKIKGKWYLNIHIIKNIVIIFGKSTKLYFQ